MTDPELTPLMQSRLRISEVKLEILRAIGEYRKTHEDLTYEELNLALCGVLERNLQHVHFADYDDRPDVDDDEEDEDVQ